uniref:Uncharacterized protein n=1 Tax=Lactuca sativa TaxID=4236 RepID=A0A9R1VJK2_LACSA|nr:hypothetical protein LSAT_V11C500239300 [Lactuca sativa]
MIGSSLIVDVHYNGVFSPNPLVYFDPDIASVRDVDFNTMVFSDYITLFENLTKKIHCKDVYYYLPHERLSEGLGVIQNEGDYREFLEVGNGSQEKRINLYIDQYNEPIFDWIEEENPDEYDSIVDNEYEVDDSTFSDTILPDHKEDEVVLSKKPLDDSFLNALCVGIVSKAATILGNYTLGCESLLDRGWTNSRAWDSLKFVQGYLRGVTIVTLELQDNKIKTRDSKSLGVLDLKHV